MWGCVIVQWSNVLLSATTGSFEVILHENGDIYFMTEATVRSS